MAARRSVFRLAALVLASFALHAPAASDATGIWQGTLERDGARLEVEATFSRRGKASDGTLSAAQLRAVRIPMAAVQLDPARVRFEMRGEFATLVAQGKLSGDALAGTFTEGNASGTFNLRRVAASRFPAREEEIAFEGAGGTALAGAIVWPAGEGPFPAVVFLHGPEPEGRWPSRYLAHEFARSGIAALIYDERGVGASKGDLQKPSFEDIVKDSSAAVDVLRARQKIGAIGIHGHGLGGTLAPWVAATNRNVWFVIASAASGDATADFDPSKYWRQVTVPALLVYGERDESVTASASIAAINASARRKPDQIIVFPEADHAFWVKRTDAAGFAWPQNAPGYPDRMIGWVHGVLSR